MLNENSENMTTDEEEVNDARRNEIRKSGGNE